MAPTRSRLGPEGARLVEVYDAWMDLVLGGRCVGCGRRGRLLCAPCAGTLPRTGHPTRPYPCPPGLVRCTTGGDYAGLLRTLVVEHKEHARFGLAGPLGDVLSASVQSLLRGRAEGGPVLLVPVPSRGPVVRTRGHDPLLRVVRRAARSLRRERVPARVVLMLRTATPVVDQRSLGADARRRNLPGTMRARPGRRDGPGPVLHGRMPRADAGVVVCDDVLTTGATAREAQRALQEAGVDVLGVSSVAATRRRAPTISEAPLPISGSAG